MTLLPMPIARCLAPAALAAVSLTAMFSHAQAASIKLDCARTDFVNPLWTTPLTFAYDGDARGTLKVGGTFGEFSIPAKRAPLEIQPGEMGEAIDAVASAHVKLPALADLEACILGQASADGGAEAYATARDLCLQKLQPLESGVDAVAQVRLGVGGVNDGSGEDAFVVFKLVYSAPSRAPGGKMSVEAFPAQCLLKK